MDKSRNYYQNSFHHVYNRGANKESIFFEHENYTYFLDRMKEYSRRFEISILSFCLMQNHFHMFLKQTSNNFSISQFLSSLLNSYVKSINKKYQRSGTLFEGKTKSKEIKDNAYFIWVIKYILENPVKAGLVSSVGDWEFSNARDLLGVRNGDLTDVNYVSSFFDSQSVMIKFLLDKGMKIPYEF
ncbi:transposase [Methylocaldum sp.]|uniref:transposase n=1 Tax=Methylocaldum sp. TaxID=1969727 RepID=UPI002D3E2687|nr:transposase [Methylocaldum sp.]HYE38264.1 transposase [Methylocaldum sp.]